MTWIAGAASAVIAGFLPIREAAELTDVGILLILYGTYGRHHSRLNR